MAQVRETEKKSPQPESYLPQEGELSSPEDMRTLARFYYFDTFRNVDPSLVVDTSRVTHPEGIEEVLRNISAERYIDAHAEKLGMSASLLRRWAQNAALEVAAQSLGTFTHYMGITSELTGKGWREIIPITERIQEQGLEASVADHVRLVGMTQYANRPTPVIFDMP